MMKIFYTDDDPDDQDIFKDAINELAEPIELWTQNTGGELIDLLQNPPPQPHLIFLDLNMPIRNGYEILKEIRETEQLKDFPVVVFSTSDDEKAINTTRQLGANLYIPKPSSFNSLKKVIRHSLSIDWQTFAPTQDTYVYRV
ncbi:response regulator [Segetibacter sp. 3557_3]|uniref:response regulator n=1 Tax=Segetibacter sp. 3557_3 TaxID=2547429 RepID=UPI0010588759|nr:response regulator [Segetibacter sp. 3557_3]TDH26544.1 response regulator [Segetibacter sp. 3557_3]